MPKGKEKKQLEAVTRDYTINLHKRLHKITFKQRAPRAIREIAKFAKLNMLTTDIRVDQKLNQFLWSRGIRNVPKRVRVRMSRRRNEDTESSEKFYTLVQHINVPSFKRLETEINTGEAKN
mmetsp:Transcript_121364/g.170635  ORF Transcript_121364/g.170635 Transcript_121364/m.170635 type:complete len:121 (+) Transcript_121364:83-445(+)